MAFGTDVQAPSRQEIVHNIWAQAAASTFPQKPDAIDTSVTATVYSAGASQHANSQMSIEERKVPLLTALFQFAKDNGISFDDSGTLTGNQLVITTVESMMENISKITTISYDEILKLVKSMY